MFIEQFKYNIEITLDWEESQLVTKKPDWEYTWRWRHVASQVQPPLPKKETSILF